MGSGLAKVLADNYPGVREADIMDPRTPKQRFGSLTKSRHHLNGGDTIYICNLYSQYNYGREPGVVYTNYAMLKSSMMLAVHHYKNRLWVDHRKPLFVIPSKIGCGLGGGNPYVVAGIIEDVFLSQDYVTFEL